MLIALLTLIGCQLAGELVRAVFGLPIPGPVIGMFMLATGLAVRSRYAKPGEGAFDRALQRIADMLIAYMGLLFVPAGAGIVAEAGLLRQEWLPIVVALVGSTVLSLAVTGLVMHWTMRPRTPRTDAAFHPTASPQRS